MPQLVLNISDPSVLPTLKKVVTAFNGVTIEKNPIKKLKKNGLDEALEDVAAGRISGPFNTVYELMTHLMR